MTNKVIRGPSVTIGEDVYAVPDLHEEIQQAEIEDSENPDTVNEALIDAYLEHGVAGRAAIDDFCAAYCGAKFSTLLKNAEGVDPELLTALGLAGEDAAPTQNGG